MARSKPPKVITASAATVAQQVSGRPVSGNGRTLMGSAQIFKQNVRPDPQTDRSQIAKPWQVEAYRHINICGEARYAATLFAAMAARAEIGVSQPQALARKAVWVDEGPEVEAFAELASTNRERTRLVRDYMLHRVIAGECYLVARKRVRTDPGYVSPPDDPTTGKPFVNWEAYLKTVVRDIDPLDDESYDPDFLVGDPNVDNPIWEIVSVTEIQKVGDGRWQVKHDNGNWLTLDKDDPVIRMWSPDPNDRREAWSPFRSLLDTLREIEYLTKHIFTQVRSRLMSAGVWFLPNNLTFPPPPPDSVQGGAEKIATLNEAELFAVSLANSGMQMLDDDEVSFPTIVTADAEALAAIDQEKLIQFWSEIDDKAMILRSDAVRRFALGMDLPPEQVLGSSGLAVTGAGGSAGSVNHWGVWANEEQTISAHIEPALDDLVDVLTSSFLQRAVPGTLLVIAYDTASLRLRQDRSKEALELHDRGLLKAEVTLREVGFDPKNDLMEEKEFRRWILVKLASGSASPEMMNAAVKILGVDLDLPETTEGSETGDSQEGKALPGRNEAPSLDEHPYEGPPRVQHDQTEAPFSALHASCEALVLRALEKAGNRLLNDGKRGRDRDRSTPPHLAHLTASIERTVIGAEFDFSMASTLLSQLPARQRDVTVQKLGMYCAEMYQNGDAYTRDGLIAALERV